MPNSNSKKFREKLIELADKAPSDRYVIVNDDIFIEEKLPLIRKIWVKLFGLKGRNDPRLIAKKMNEFLLCGSYLLTKSDIEILKKLQTQIESLGIGQQDVESIPIKILIKKFEENKKIREKTASLGFFKLQILKELDATKDESAIIKENPELLKQFLEISPVAKEGLSGVKAIQLAAKCPALNTINLSDCPDLKDEDIQRLVEQCPNIQKLLISDSIHLTEKALKSISQLKSLKILELKNLSLPNRGFECLNAMSNLTSLTLNGLDQLTDESLSFLPALSNLQYLGISRCPGVTDEGLKNLRSLKNLVSLDLSWNRYTGGGFANLSGLTELKQINLSNSKRLRDRGLIHFKGLANLISLDLTHCKNLNEQGLTFLTSLTGLSLLKLGWCALNNNDISLIGKNLINLLHLDLTGSDEIDYNGINELQNLSKIEHLNLSWTKVDERICESTSNLKQMEDLSLLNCIELSDICLRSLKNLPKLAILNLTGCELITDAGLKELSAQKNLVSLNLTDCLRITDDGLGFISQMEKLIILKLRECSKITDKGIKKLTSLPQLTGLDLYLCTSLTDESAKELCTLPLIWLDFGGCNITDLGLSYIGLMDELQSINLTGCQNITDLGLLYLANLYNLRTVDLSDCPQITFKGLEQLPWEGKLMQLIKPSHL